MSVPTLGDWGVVGSDPAAATKPQH